MIRNNLFSRGANRFLQQPRCDIGFRMIEMEGKNVLCIDMSNIWWNSFLFKLLAVADVFCVTIQDFGEWIQSPISLFTQFALFALSRFISFFRRIFLRIEKRKIENNLLGFFSWLGQQQWELEPRHKDRRCCSWCSLPLILYFSILVIRL